MTSAVSTPENYAEQRAALIVHSYVAVAGLAVIVLVNALTNAAAGRFTEWSAWWCVWAVLGWTSGLAVHGFVVWLNRPMQNELGY